MSVDITLLRLEFVCCAFCVRQMECDEKELRREIMYAITNIHAIRLVSSVFKKPLRMICATCFTDCLYWPIGIC